MTTHEILVAAKEAAPSLACLKTAQKNAGLLAMADALKTDADVILEANEKDLKAAQGKISEVMLDRLRLTEERIAAMANDIRHVASLPDPVGEVLEEKQTESGLHIRKVRVPMGVVAMIYESRPNVTSDAATLAVKSGNAAVLRCGKEAHRSSLAIVDALQKGLVSVGIPEKAVQLIEDTSRESAVELMCAVGLVDLLIPRGGAGLIRSCVENAKVPVIQTGTGICHLYVDKDADFDTALRVIENAKCSRPSVCNAEEVCLVDRPIAKTFLPMLRKRLTDERIAGGKDAVELRLDETAAGFIDGKPADKTDFDTEFLDYILAVKVVDGVTEAVTHIAKHSTKHSDGIITKNREAADFFTAVVDSAAVYVNTSTRFTDGGVFGLGCEIGISTQKLHARGPMGLCELTTYKYIVESEGKIR